MLNKLGVLLWIAVAAQTAPLYAQEASRSPQVQSSQAHDAQLRCQCVAPQNGPAPGDVTGSIDKGAQGKVTVAPVDASRVAPPAPPAPQGKPPVTYEQAFRDWRACAVTHQGIGNPPPQCEPLRLALRKAISLRPRGDQSADAGPRS